MPTFNSSAPSAYTTGHCKENAKKGGCQLHNLHCGWPECDRRPAPAPPMAEADALYGRLVPARLRAYLTGGGLFNPELANHDAVRNLIIDSRHLIECQAREIAEETRRANRWFDFADQQERRAERAEAMLDALKRELEITCAHLGLDHLLAERDALRADAERYRWLRDHKGNNREPHIAQHPYCAEIDAVEYPYFVKVGLDAAIDAARAKMPHIPQPKEYS